MGIRKDKTRKTYTYTFQYQGREYGGRGFKTRREAESARAERRKELRESSKQIPPVMGFREAASAYLDHSERKHAKQTYQYKKLTYKAFQASQGDLPILDITPGHISNYLASLPSNAVYNARRKDLSALFTWLKNMHGIPLVNPCNKVDKMPHVPKNKQVPTPDEINRLLLAAKPGDEQDIIMSCIHLSGRIDEILRLKWQEDINFDKRVVVLRTKKRKSGAYEADTMHMNQDLYDVLWKRWNTKTQNTWVFYNEKTGDRYYHRPKMMAAICARAKINPIGQSKRKIPRGENKGKYETVNLYYGFHALRHFVPSILMDEKKHSMKTLQRVLRHKNMRTTEIYVHPVDESVKVALTNLEGRFTPNSEKPVHEPGTQAEKELPTNGVTP